MKQESGKGFLGPAAVRRVAGCAVLAWLLAGAGTASAAVGPAGVRTDNNVTVFHNIDFVAAFGHTAGAAVQVDVVRGPHRVATARGEAITTPEGPGLEVNHGVETAAIPGDCWEGATPDVHPGDLIRVTSDGGVDEVIVDDISIASVTRRPGADATPGNTDDEIWVEGVARSGVDGSAIPVGRLDSGEFRSAADGQLRLTPTRVEAVDAGAGTFRAVYAGSNLRIDRNRNNHSTARILELLQGDGHAVGFGHVAPLPLESMLVDGVASAPGPAVGCEAAPAAASSAGTTSADALNVETTSGLVAEDVALTVGGWAEQTLETAEVEVRDEEGTTVVEPVDGLAAGATQQGWGASLTLADLEPLAQGELSVRMLVAGAPVGATRTVEYDTVAPSFSVSPEPGTYTGTQKVAVDGDPGTFRVDGGPRRLYDGQIIVLEPGSHTLELSSTDEAGNVTTRTFEYRINAEPLASADPALSQIQPRQAVLAAPLQALTQAPAAQLVSAASPAPAPVARVVRGPVRIGLATARRSGLRATFDAPSGARGATVQAYRLAGGGRQLIGSRTLRIRAGRTTVAVNAAAVRRKLRPGGYALRIVLRDAAGRSGKAVSATVRVAR
jgi:hypothetical protein